MGANCNRPGWGRTLYGILHGLLLLGLLALAAPSFGDCDHDHSEPATEQALTCCTCHMSAVPPITATPPAAPDPRLCPMSGPTSDTGVSVRTTPFEPPRA
jgi:hypothetical protein